MGDKYDELSERVEHLEKSLKQLKNSANPRAPRKPSEYNLFVGKRCEELRKEHPDYKQDKIFTMAVNDWNEKKKEASADKSEEPKKTRAKKA